MPKGEREGGGEAAVGLPFKHGPALGFILLTNQEM